MSTRGSETKMLILDEPTANLPGAEAQRLYKLVRSVADRGIAVLFVSHHFDEVFEMADSVTVLRDAKHIITRPVEGLTEEELIELVVGRKIEVHVSDAEAREHGKPVIELKGLQGAAVQGLDLTVHEGEVVGIAGITGSGREEVAALVFGGHGRGGEVIVNGEVLPECRPDISIERGIALVPAERHANASLMDHTLRENITIVNPAEHMNMGFLRRSSERSDVNEWLDKLDVRPRNSEYTMAQLSGGNQQKVVIARWMRQEPSVLILDEPTQGVDVGAKSDIHRLVDEAAAQGTAVLVASTDHEELVRLCDRVIIMRRGKAVSVLKGATLTNDGITAASIGRDSSESAA
jgi:ribose transport system ATP-binding protein